MSRLIRRAAPAAVAAVAAVVAVSAGLTTPASATHAQTTSARADFLCPRIIAICGYTEPGGQGHLTLFFDAQDEVDPPIASAQNNTLDVWCFFSETGFAGERREVAPGETVYDFGFPVLSAAPHPCA